MKGRNPQEVAARIRETIQGYDTDLAGMMAVAMLECLAKQWDTYDATVDTLTIATDTNEAAILAARIAFDIARGLDK